MERHARQPPSPQLAAVRDGGAEGDDRDERIERLEQLARILDSNFRIPGTRVRFGVDSLLGLVPGVGDAAGAVLSAVVLREAARLGASRTLLLRMVGNVALDLAVGAIPVIGDVFDVAFKANRRNVRLLLSELGRRPASG